MRRVPAFAAALSLALSLVGPSASVAETASVAAPWCDTGVPRPCIVSATRNGSPVTESDPTWELSVVGDSVDGERFFLWSVQKKGAPDPYELGADSLSDVWRITFDPGTMVPRVVSTTGDNVTVSRTGSGVTVTATPTIVTDNDECNVSSWPWTCPETAGDERVGYLGGQVTDYGVWADVSQREAMYGMNQSTNVAVTSMPPEIVSDPITGAPQLLIRLANQHYRADGTTLFRGNIHLRIPNLFLRRVYGIDDPSTLTTSGLVTTGAGSAASVSVTQEPSRTAMLVDIDGMTFSNRQVRIRRGVITPTRPTSIRARRVSPTRGVVRFKAAKARGSRITGYRARCVHGSDVEVGKSRRSPVVVAGLERGVGYRCGVRALSKAGAGRWSAAVRLPRRP